MSSYCVKVEPDPLKGPVLRVGFGDPAQNNQIVRDAAASLAELETSGQLPGGKLVRINGPASLPAALVLGHHLAHRYGSVAVFDPKLGSYVVAISHDPGLKLGDLID